MIVIGSFSVENEENQMELDDLQSLLWWVMFIPVRSIVYLLKN